MNLEQNKIHGTNYENNRMFKDNDEGKDRKKHTDIEHSLEGHTVSDQWFIQFNIFWQRHQGEFCGKACHSRSLILPSKG